MSEKKKSTLIIPLKVKVLFGLSLLVATVLLVNSIYSFNLFLKDKTSYIFENGLQKAEEISDKLVAPLNQSLNKVNSFIFLANQNEAQFQQILNSDDRINLFIYKDGEKEWKVFAKTTEDRDGKRRGEDLKQWWEAEKLELNFSSKITMKGKKIDDQYYASVFFEKDDQKILILLNYSDLLEDVQKSQVYSFYLAANEGESFFGGITAYPSYFKEIFQSPITKGVKTVMGDQKKELLVSYVRYPSLGFSLISEITKEKAFSIAKDLIARNLYFGLAVLGIALLVGLVFSLQVTRPIRKLVEATNWIAEGDFSKRVEIKSKDEFRILGKSFNFMSSEIETMISQLEDANAQLEEYNKNLEKMVEERTAELKKANDFIATMINSLDQGLLVFDDELKVADIYTKACTELFDTELEGKTYTELLRMDEKTAEGVGKWSKIVFSEKIPFSSASRLGPQQFVIGETPDDDNFKHISLEYHPMRGEEGIENIVAVATDKTDEVRAIEATKVKEAYVEMIMKLIHSKRQFNSFLEEVNDILKTLQEELMKEAPNPDTLLINYHSLNGGFGTYSVYSLQKKARSCEQFIVDNKGNEETFTVERLRADYEEFAQEYQSFLEDLENVFGKNRETIEIDKSLIIYFSDLLEEKTDVETALLFKEYFERESVELHFEGYKELVKDLSGKLSKQIAPLKIKNGDVRIPPEKTKEFFNSLVHLFRNCVDHGIESPSERAERNKPEEGKIIVSFNKERTMSGDETLTVTVEDDGGGINPDKIREKWKSLHPDDEEIDNLSNDEIIYKIFDPNFSTAEEVTEVSGRGVGMSAIKEVIDKNGGSLIVHSKVGIGSRFEFRLPL